MDANQLLMGSGTNSATFKTIGDTVVGTILAEPRVQQQTSFKDKKPEFWPDGNPKMMIVVDLATDQRDPEISNDDGRRSLFIRGKSMTEAVRSAVKATGAPGLAVGGKLAIRYVSGVGEAGDPKIYEARYEPPVAGGDLAGLVTTAATAPAQPAEPAPAVAAGPPAGVDPQVWAGLPEQQRQAILAATGQNQQFAF